MDVKLDATFASQMNIKTSEDSNVSKITEEQAANQAASSSDGAKVSVDDSIVHKINKIIESEKIIQPNARVNALKAQIELDHYKIDFDKLADKLTQSIFFRTIGLGI